jgi:hypothetical protein
VAAAVGATEQKLAAAHKALLETRGLQFDFKTFTPPEPPGWMEALLRFLTAIAPILKYVFWGGLIVGALLIAWFILREVVQVRFGPRRKATAPAAWRPEPDRARALLDDADRLAQDGCFDEAIHLLLFRSIDDITGRRPGLVGPALTSRDIARLDAMPSEAAGAFERIATAVERSFFGGRPAGEDDFTRARQDYEAFAFSGAWA